MGVRIFMAMTKCKKEKTHWPFHLCITDECGRFVEFDSNKRFIWKKVVKKVIDPFIEEIDHHPFWRTTQTQISIWNILLLFFSTIGIRKFFWLLLMADLKCSITSLWMFFGVVIWLNQHNKWYIHALVIESKWDHSINVILFMTDYRLM